MGKLSGSIGPHLGTDVLVIAGDPQVLVIVDDDGLDEDDQFLARVAVAVILEEVAKHGHTADEGKARGVFLFLVGNQAAENDGMAARHGDGGDDLLGANDGHVIRLDALGADDAVINLGDGEIDLAVRIDEGDNLKLEHHIKVTGGGGDGAVGIAAAHIGDGGFRIRNLLAGGDHCLFVVQREHGRAGKNLEVVCGVEGVDNGIETLAELAVQIESSGGTDGRGDQVVTDVGDVVVRDDVVAIGDLAARPCVAAAIEIPAEVVDTKFESITDGKLADDRGQIYLGRLAIESVEKGICLLNTSPSPRD